MANGLAIAGYVVKRYNALNGAAAVVGPGCSGLQSTTCTEQSAAGRDLDLHRHAGAAQLDRHRQPGQRTRHCSVIRSTRRRMGSASCGAVRRATFLAMCRASRLTPPIRADVIPWRNGRPTK